MVHCVILDPIVVIIVFEVFVTLFFCLLRSVNRRSPPPLHPWLLAGVVGTLGRLNPRRHFYVCVRELHCTATEMRVCDLLGSCLVGKCLYSPKLRYIQTTILHNVQSQHFVRGKGRWEEMR